jgi:hypothetical protein
MLFGTRGGINYGNGAVSRYKRLGGYALNIRGAYPAQRI